MFLKEYFAKFLPDGWMNRHIEAKYGTGIESWDGFRDGSRDDGIDKTQWARQWEQERQEIWHLLD